MSNSPLVSICCLTYNHEPYIRDCLEGFVMQQTNFIFEVLIHDDASTDNTAAIIREYEVKYPSIIKPIYQTENQYSKGVKVTSVYNFPRVKGQYVAMCEGDDYWIDPLKLQKQVDFLECNQDYSFSMSRVDVLIEKTKEIKKRKELVNPTQKEYFTLRDYLKSPFSQTSSFMFKNDDFDFPSWTAKTHAGDQTLVVLKTGLKGKIKYHEECFSIYRLNENSISFKAKYDVYEKFIETLGYWHEYLNYEYTTIFTLRKWKTRTQSNYSKHNVGLLMKIYTKIKLRLIDVLLKIV